MAVQDWCNKARIAALAIPALLAIGVASPSRADDKPASTPAIKVVPPLPIGAETKTYTDPRKRFSIRHDDDWVLMPNWVGGIEIFCRWEGCQKTALTSCNMSIADAGGLREEDVLPLSSVVEGTGLSETLPLGILGSARFLPGGSVKEIAGRKWAESGVGVKLLDRIPVEARDWMTIAGGQFYYLSCAAHDEVMPGITARMERLLSGMVVTKP
jgi:hypothetical protein